VVCSLRLLRKRAGREAHAYDMSQDKHSFWKGNLLV